jgi:hypothetical protein
VADRLEALIRVILLALIRAAAGLKRERRVGRARTGAAERVSCTRRARWPGPRPGARDRQYRRSRWWALARTVSSPSAANALATSGRSGIVRRAHKGRKGSRGRRFGKNCNLGVTRWLCGVAFSPTSMCPAGSVAQPSAETTVLQRTLVSYKARHNEDPPVFQLHLEILVEIFGWLQHRQGTMRDDDRPWKTYDPEWTRVMAVCRLFRDIALGALSLWTTLDYEGSSDAWRQLCVARSGAAALAIHGHGPSAAKYLSRARTAHFRDIGESTYLLYEPAPSLRILKVVLFMNDEDQDEEQTLSISANLLGGHVRSLVSLILCGPRIHLHQAPFMPTLRFLEVDRVLLIDGMHSLGGIPNNTPDLEALSVFRLSFTGDLEPIRQPIHSAVERLHYYKPFPHLQQLAHVRAYPKTINDGGHCVCRCPVPPAMRQLP